MSFLKSSGADWLIVGLGNPGREYETTRHNTGFMVLDKLAGSLGVSVNKVRFKGLVGSCSYHGKKLILLKPETYMNASGIAVEAAAHFYRIPNERIIVIFDDISLPCGKLRIRRKGTDGGHNGIKSIIYHLNSDNFPRIKVGIGAKPHPDYNLADWVLSTFDKDEMDELMKAIQKAVDVLPDMLDRNIDKAMNKAN